MHETVRGGMRGSTSGMSAMTVNRHTTSSSLYLPGGTLGSFRPVVHDTADARSAQALLFTTEHDSQGECLSAANRELRRLAVRRDAGIFTCVLRRHCSERQASSGRREPSEEESEEGFLLKELDLLENGRVGKRGARVGGVLLLEEAHRKKVGETCY